MPASAAVRLASVSIVFVWPGSGELLNNHWKDSGVQPLAATLKLAEPPIELVWPIGWLVMAGK